MNIRSKQQRRMQHVYRSVLASCLHITAMDNFIITVEISQNITSHTMNECGITNFAQVKIHKRTGRKNQ